MILCQLQHRRKGAWNYHLKARAEPSGAFYPENLPTLVVKSVNLAMGHQNITPGEAVVKDFEVLGLCRGKYIFDLGNVRKISYRRFLPVRR